MCFISTHIPASKLPKVQTSDVVLHGAAFFVIATLFVLSLIAYRASVLHRVLLAISVMTLYASFDEITQGFFNRHTAFTDWLADLVGAGLAIVIVELVFLAFFRPGRKFARGS